LGIFIGAVFLSTMSQNLFKESLFDIVMSFYKNLLMHLPEVAAPTQKRSLKQRLLWTFGILILFLFLASVPLYGITQSQAEYFKSLELLLGAKIGMLLTLGIGPIVTASIVLQLLKGAGILHFDMHTEEGKFVYNGTHKLLTFAFILIEAFVYAAFGAVSPDPSIPNSMFFVVLQLALGGFVVVFMDEIVKKWGFGSGVSIFIAAGIAGAVFIQLFSPFTATGEFSVTDADNLPVGKIWQLFLYLPTGNFEALFTTVLFPIAITVGLFFLIVFFQAVNVEIPLSFGRVRGQGMRWPLNFFYAGVIPVILISALSANIRLWAGLLDSSLLNTISSYLTSISLVDNWRNILSLDVWPHILSYTLFLVVGSTVFAYFWVQTANMDARSQAQSILRSGLQIPGFRKDVRIIERVLDRYIIPLTIMGGIGIGLLASTADMLSALTSGTGVLLMVMIIYQFYQQLARESLEDFSLLQKFMKR
jgi:preprotein translocase subunit SecY